MNRIELNFDDLKSSILTHFIGRGTHNIDVTNLLRPDEEFESLVLEVNKLIQKQPVAQQAFDSPVDMLKFYAANKFEASWYLSRYLDVAAADIDPSTHFDLYGREEGRFPNALAETSGTLMGFFDANWYTKRYVDVAASGIDPLFHFENYGREEGRFANRLAEKRLAFAEHLDRDWYLSRYHDVAQAALDPFEHYVRYGFEEHRFPNKDAEVQAESPKEDFGEFLSLVYLKCFSKPAAYFEMTGWLRWYRLGVSRFTIRSVVEFCTGVGQYTDSGQ